MVNLFSVRTEESILQNMRSAPPSYCRSLCTFHSQRWTPDVLWYLLFT